MKKRLIQPASLGESAYRIICYVIPTLFALLCLYPLCQIFFVSLVSKAEWSQNNGLVLGLPLNPTLAAYEKVLKSNPYILKSLGVSVVRTLLSTIGGVILAAILGYILSRKNLPGKGIISGLVVFSIFFNGGLIPNFLTVNALQIRNTIWALVLPGLLNTWYALIFKQFFEAIPEEVEEAALIDGVTELQLFSRIVLPMSMPVVASISLFTIVNSWNSWFDAMVYIDSLHSDLWPLQYYVTITFNNLTQIDQSSMSDLMEIIGTNRDVPEIATKMALTIISIFPVLCTFPFFQKYFTKGVYMGSVK